MRSRGDKVLIGFLILSMLFLLVALVFFKGKAVRSKPAQQARSGAVAAVPRAVPAAVADSGDYSLARYFEHPESVTHRQLPSALNEISGLAVTGADRLLAHNDESGVVCELEASSGAIVKSFALSDISRPVADDFEGIAAVGDLLYLVTSSGRLYECGEGNNGESVLFNVYTTGIGRECEIEGLAYEPSRRALLMMTKEARSDVRKGLLTIFSWSLETKRLIGGAEIAIPVEEFTRLLGGDEFHPSGIERHPVSGHYFIVAARETAIAEITPEGTVIAVAHLPGNWHHQAEGITFDSHNTLLVSDEAAGARAELTQYPLAGLP